MNNTNQTQNFTQKDANVSLVQTKPSSQKPLSSFIKYVSKKQLIIVGSLLALIIILLGVSLITKGLGKKGFTDKTGDMGFGDNPQSKVQIEMSSPEKTTEEYLKLLSGGKTNEAKLLISQKANMTSFAFDTDFKNFTFKIQKTITEAPGTISYVSVEIVMGGEKSRHYFTLLKDRESGVWLLVKHESLSAGISDSQESSL